MECCGKEEEGTEAEVVADVCGVHACVLQQEFQRQQQEALKRLQQQQAMQNIQVATGPPIDRDLPAHLVHPLPHQPPSVSHFSFPSFLSMTCLGSQVVGWQAFFRHVL